MRTAETRRLGRWAAAFEAWLAELQANFERSTHKQAMLAWRRLLWQQRSHFVAASHVTLAAHYRRPQSLGADGLK